LSADITLVTIGGEEKTACKTGDAHITYPDGRRVTHGQLSWALGQALLQCLPGSAWRDILYTMTQLISQQQIALEVQFHGQVTAPLHH
jgi:hypothetical protein